MILPRIVKFLETERMVVILGWEERENGFVV
jgi:hypothetical protein